jgi:hypothetical protein
VRTSTESRFRLGTWQSATEPCKAVGQGTRKSGSRRVGALSRALVAGAIVLAVTGCTSHQPSRDTEQGWTRVEQLAWYHANQGSRLIPLAWAQALEEAGSTAKLFEPRRMAAFGYLPPDADDASGLPIGFSVDRSDDSNLVRSRLSWKTGQPTNEPWLGMTCAACHTGQIEAPDGKPLRIEGGQSLGDFQSFVEALDTAARATLNDPAKFDRFAQAVLRQGKTADQAKLRKSLADFLAWEDKLDALNNPQAPLPATQRYGFGRLDAFGHIFNKVAALTQADEQFQAFADAPVSYPFLWNVPQHDRVQWNGIAPNRQLPTGEPFDLGALGRNTGEVIGVFADVEITQRHPGIKGYASSIDVKNLDAMEVQLGRLLPPRWPEVLGRLDTAKVDAGRRLFADHCASCHAVLDRADLKTPIKAVMTPIWGARGVGTDPWMACNAFTYRAGSSPTMRSS